MPCPSTQPISGDSSLTAGFYTSRAAALQEANNLLQSRAEVEAGLKFNGFDCPQKCCKQKSLGAVTATVASSDTSWSLIASAFYFESRYSATLKFNWSAAVGCASSCSDLARAFIRDFEAAVLGRLAEFGNPVFWFWADWAISWLTRNGLRERYKVRLCHYWKLGLKHQIVVVTLPDGTQLVLDPWRDNNSPVWVKEDYEQEFGKLTCEDLV